MFQRISISSESDIPSAWYKTISFSVSKHSEGGEGDRGKRGDGGRITRDTMDEHGYWCGILEL